MIAITSKQLGRLARFYGEDFVKSVRAAGSATETGVAIEEAQWLPILTAAQEVSRRSPVNASAAPSGPKGLGDAVAAVATPIARALKLPCIDPATQELRPDSGCAKRRRWLNNLSK